MSKISFETLRQANAYRASDADKYNFCDKWTASQWMMALVGEVGELANYLKKIDRGDFTLEEKKIEVGKEIADIQIYLDLLALYLDIDLGTVTVDKYNEVSDRIGAGVYINHNDTWTTHPWDNK
jgi:NTP pyrophosphatase (non-canonical NTP hydrolase)